jgi:hypothetical protein
LDWVIRYWPNIGEASSSTFCKAKSASDGEAASDGKTRDEKRATKAKPNIFAFEVAYHLL